MVHLHFYSPLISYQTLNMRFTFILELQLRHGGFNMVTVLTESIHSKKILGSTQARVVLCGVLALKSWNDLRVRLCERNKQYIQTFDL